MRSTLFFLLVLLLSSCRMGLEEAAEWSRHFAELEREMDRMLAALFEIPLDRLVPWLQPGRYVKNSATPLSNLFLSMADRMGAKGLARHGDSTGRLTVI